MREDGTSDIVEHPSPLAFAATVDRLTLAISRAGLTLFATIDHAAGAHDVGMVMPPTTVLIYGHPKGGTPIMLAAPRAALDLPLRLLVRERDDGGVVVAFHPIGPMLLKAGVPVAMTARLEPAQRLLVEALAS